MAGAKAFTGNGPKVRKETVLQLPQKLLQQQEAFLKTGGLHAAGLFDANGEIKVLQEDVGRHNAVDKIAGALLQDTMLIAAESLLLVSGRTSFEIVQKAIRAGIPFVAAVGARVRDGAGFAVEPWFRESFAGHIVGGCVC